ncbi:MAG: hypothetical protein DDT41_01215 [candidate division WS2 bacterium]|nr:hypothetical protein [Candidatus Psychracetigena formicireducens]
MLITGLFCTRAKATGLPGLMATPFISNLPREFKTSGTRSFKPLEEPAISKRMSTS